MLENVLKTQELFRFPIKKYGQIAFTLTYLSVEIRVNEMQSTDTTLVHKHKQQTLKVKHKSKGRENANTR